MVRTSEGYFYAEEYPSGRYLGPIPRQLGECLLTQELDNLPFPELHHRYGMREKFISPGLHSFGFED